MQDAFAYCDELVRTADRDRFIASLFAPAEGRGALHALYAFNVELTRVRDVAQSALPGEIRLQWWREVVNGERAGEATANPVAVALLATIAKHDLPLRALIELIEAHRADLYDDPFATMADFLAYARQTSSALVSLAARVLAATDFPDAALPAGIAYAIVVLLRALPAQLARGRLAMPAELLGRHQILRHDLSARRTSPGLVASLAELRLLARQNLAEAGTHLGAVPHAALPAFLPVALVGATLDRLQRADPFAPAELPAWRRQWLIWRAARHPARIAQ